MLSLRYGDSSEGVGVGGKKDMSSRTVRAWVYLLTIETVKLGLSDWRERYMTFETGRCFERRETWI